MKKLATLALLSTVGALSAPAAITDNLVAYWDFEGGTNNNAAASGGSAYNGTLQGNAAVTGGATKVGTGSLVLDGAGDYLDVTSIVDPNQPWSVSAWYRADVAPSGSTRFMVFETSGSYPMSFGIREAATTTNTNHQAFADVTPSADTSADFQIADAATIASWHHVLLSFTPANATTAGSILVFIDGTLRNTMTIPVANTLGTANGFHIGTYRAADGRWFDGAIDEVAIWNRTLNQTEAQDVFQRGNLGETLTLVKPVVILSASPAAGGTVNGAGNYNVGQQVPISAMPNPGYIFSGWDGSFTGQPASFTYTANANATATAAFSEDTADSDGDGLTNYEEIVTYQTLPNNRDTDGDEIPDGDEVKITGTNPKTSDALLVNFVRANLSPSAAGAIALSPLGITRNPTTGAISLSLGLTGSANRSVWQDIDLSQPPASIVPSGDGWSVTFPAPSNSVNSYILLGSRP
jgi:hypothetical protein